MKYLFTFLLAGIAWLLYGQHDANTTDGKMFIDADTVRHSFGIAIELKICLDLADESLTIETEFPGFALYRIFRTDGSLVKSGEFSYQPIGLGCLSSGVYLLQLIALETSFSKTVKIIRQ